MKKIVFIFLITFPVCASAHPCQNLATTFQSTPDEMSLSELAKFRTCISNFIDYKINENDPVPKLAPAPRPD